MSASSFASHARHCEDVVLWRALGGLGSGRYVEFGFGETAQSSVSQAFYEASWDGIAAETAIAAAELIREQRPRDMVFHTRVISENSRSGAPGRSFLDLLVEAGWEQDDVHFLAVRADRDVAEVLGAKDLQTVRPWVIVISTGLARPLAQVQLAWRTALLEADYELTLNDGYVSYYVAAERAELLRADLDHVAGGADAFQTDAQRSDDERLVQLAQRAAAAEARLAELEARVAEAVHARDAAEADAIRWRLEAINKWSAVHSTSGSGLSSSAHVRGLEETLVAMEHTLSWRITRPIRAVRRLMLSRSSR